MARPLALLLSFAALLLSPQPTTTTATAAAPASKGFSLKLIDRDSVHSPLYPGNLTIAQQLQRMVRLSEARALWLKSTILPSQDVEIRPSVTPDNWKYTVSLSIGNPPTDQLLVLDTASDIIWAQCSPCEQCFPQAPPMFRPADSNTFHDLPCHHSLCQPKSCLHNVCQLLCINHVCHFIRRYGHVHNSAGQIFAGQIFTKGTLATEHFTFRSRTGHSESIRDVVFGCSRSSSEDFFKSSTDRIAGILGMNSGSHSLVSQLGDRIQRRFSYCLLPRDHQGSSYLRFGNDIVVRRNAQTTPILETNDRTKLYFLFLMDISINNRRLNFPPGTFTRRNGVIGGCFIDSGAGISFLIRPAFDLVKGNLMNYFQQYNLHMLEESYTADLCYVKPHGFQAFPSMVLHFAGADLPLGTENLFMNMIDNGRSVFCLMFRPDDHYTILGAAQQTNIQFIYDIGRQQLTFAPGDCARS